MITVSNIGSFFANLVYEIFKRKSAKELHEV